MLFAACAALVVLAMGWVSDRMLCSEAAQSDTERRLRHQEAERLALWRMDTAFAPFVASQGERGWSVGMAEAARRALHLPEGPQLDDERVRARFLAQSSALAASRVIVGVREPRTDDDARLATTLEQFGHARFASCIQIEAPAIAQAIYTANDLGPDATAAANGDANFGNRDRQQRVKSAGQNAYQSAQAQSLQVDAGPPSVPGTAAAVRETRIPLWIGDGTWLAFVREGNGGDGSVTGFVLDWARTSRALLDEVADLVPGAKLVRVEEGRVASDDTGLVLATAPAMLDAPLPPPEPVGLLTPARAGLGVAWLAVLASLGASALLLRATVADADRRARFASSVTHELRTPLTTFRLYSEMLADGMVTDTAKRQEYLETLKTESARLASLVENVLSYARVEEGRAPRQRERFAVADLVERCVPPLRRRCDEAGVSLVVRVDAPDAAVVANADAVGQVLANLVDNACKYAAPAASQAAAGPDARTVELTVERRGGDVAFRVRDHGPGLAPENVAAAFTPFERGNRPPGDVVPGIGLGLALSRGLARDHGGDLVHEAPDGGPGAAFVLTLPSA